MSNFEVKYVGGHDSVTEMSVPVKRGETISVGEERAAHLILGDAWELVGKKQPKPAPQGQVAALAVPDGDVHEASPVETAEVEVREPSSDGVEEGV